MIVRLENGSSITIGGFPSHTDQVRSGNGTYVQRGPAVMLMCTGMMGSFSAKMTVSEAEELVKAFNEEISIATGKVEVHE